MKTLLVRAFACALPAVAAFALCASGASPAAEKADASAAAYAVKIFVPGQQPAGSQTVTAPPDAVALGGAFQYPSDGSLVTTGSLSASVSADRGDRNATARATSEIMSLQLFGGEISATRLFVRATAHAGTDGASASPGGAVVTGLTVLGQSIAPTPNLKLPLADWGTATVLEQTADRKAPAGRNGARASLTVLDVKLTRDHAGLPAGTQVLVDHVDAATQAPKRVATQPQPPPPTTTGSKGKPTKPQPPATRSHKRASRKPGRKAPEPKPSPFGPAPLQAVPQHRHPHLRGGPYVFPVFGPVSFTDTFGAPRADVAWHHGDDIFAPLGAPVVAVARGTVFSVGWNDLGGNRLWLRDGQGNEFYYAHLSAYSPLAVNGKRVKAGDVLGFVGNTGDAITTPFHLHFEIHPVSLLPMGYDGAVDPTSYLTSWERLRNLSFSRGIPAGRKASYAAVRNTAGIGVLPQPGAVLLSVSDISSAAGLNPAAIKAALAGTDVASAEGQAALLGLAKRTNRRAEVRTG